MKAIQHLTSADLMIGDWIMYGDKPVQVLQLTADKEYKGFFPIPLTSEILEKNGFKNISDHTLKGSDTFRLRVEQRGFDYTITIKLRDYFRLDSYDDRVYTLCEIDFGLNCVHELQHALKLCGIYKEIIL